MMNAKGLIASCLALGIFAFSANAADVTRKMTRLESQPIGDRVPTRGIVEPTGAGTVYSQLAFAGYFPQAPTTLEQQALQAVAEDLGLAPGDLRELVSYRAMIHQRSSEGPVTFTGHLSLRDDDEGLPGGVIANASCSVPNAGPLFFAECQPVSQGDSGIIMGDTVWMAVTFEGGCAPTPEIPADCTVAPGNPQLGPGWLESTTAPPVIGTTADPAALSSDGGETWSTFVFGSGPPYFTCDMIASVPPAIPTVSEWGMVAIVLLVLTGGTIALRRSHRTVTA